MDSLPYGISFHRADLGPFPMLVVLGTAVTVVVMAP